MKKKIKNTIRDIIRIIFGKKIYIYSRFILTHKYWPNFKNPKTFSEKIIYRKLNTNPYTLSKLVDKYTVREYVEKKIGNEYLIPLIKAKDFIHAEDFDNLPNEFVLKTSNGGGGENVLIIKNKDKLNLNSICNKFNQYLNEKIGSKIDEPFYDIQKPKILFEKLIKDKNGRVPNDYKFHIFNSNEQKIFIQIDSDRFSNHKRSIYTIDGKKANFKIQPKYDEIETTFMFPENLGKMLQLAICLSEDFEYVRVDLYNCDGKIYFGEMTFCHGSGWEPIYPKSADYELGSYWEE
ncbi:ATP-grasp fold amidoligase family protein [Providencia sp. PROV236]|uniref:ATP-grasp fold amidoligase family protein n=1 Tax=Providencia sp. PROV236 TaxID=2936798 RepID=UPI0034E2AAAB